MLYLIYLVIIINLILLPVCFYLYKNNKENKEQINKLLVEKNSIVQTISKLIDRNNQVEQNIMNNLKIIQGLKEKQENFDQQLKTTFLSAEAINSRIDSLSGFFSIGKSLANKDNKKYGSINDHIIDDYKNINYRDFLDKYPDYKIIGLLNYDDIRNNRSVPPNFAEIATGQCTAILIENDLYSIVIKKGLELKEETIDSIGISFIFELSEDPIKGFFYNQWELTKLPIFQKLSNDKWVCLSKGYLKLKPNSQTLKENIERDNQSIIDEEDSDIDYFNFNSFRELLIPATSEVTNFSQRIFLSRNPDTKSLKNRKYKEKMFFNISEDGSFYSFQLQNDEKPLNSDFYFLFPKAEYLKQIFSSNKAVIQKENRLLTRIFGFNENKDNELQQNSANIKGIEEIFDILHDKNISGPKINKLAIIKLKKISKDQKQSYELIEKGEIVLS